MIAKLCLENIYTLNNGIIPPRGRTANMKPPPRRSRNSANELNWDVLNLGFKFLHKIIFGTRSVKFIPRGGLYLAINLKSPG